MYIHRKMSKTINVEKQIIKDFGRDIPKNIVGDVNTFPRKESYTYRR